MKMSSWVTCVPPFVIWNQPPCNLAFTIACWHSRVYGEVTGTSTSSSFTLKVACSHWLSYPLSYPARARAWTASSFVFWIDLFDLSSSLATPRDDFNTYGLLRHSRVIPSLVAAPTFFQADRHRLRENPFWNAPTSTAYLFLQSIPLNRGKPTNFGWSDKLFFLLIQEQLD